jgi:hypothetical protein
MYAEEVVLEDRQVVPWNNRSGHFIPHPGYSFQAPFSPMITVTRGSRAISVSSKQRTFFRRNAANR